MARLSSITRSYAVYFIISLHIVSHYVESQNIEEGQIEYEYEGSEEEEQHPIVLTPLGLIQGIREKKYAMFLGIPYAKVNKGNKFGPAEAYPKFKTIFEANNDTHVCPQLDNETPIGNIDCLNLNIYVPKRTNSENLLPVLVWIHGGEFETGSGRKDTYGPEFLIRHEIILVTLNYRLGVYGFLCYASEDDTQNKYTRSHGNQGLKDQLLAFIWITENIVAFGGDANKMTLAGEGSGSVCVDIHLHSHQARLFSKFILQGETIFSPKYTKDLKPSHGPLLNAIREDLRNTTGVHHENLNSAPSTQIVKSVGKLGFKFGLCCDSPEDNKLTILQDDPRSEKWQSQGTSKPILIGSNSDALLHYIMYAGENMTKMASAFDETVRDIMHPVPEGDFSTKFRNFYIGDKKIDNYVIRELIDFQSDYNIWHPIERRIENYHRVGAKVYRYVFSYLGERNYMKHLLNVTDGGATSADELGYLFDMNIFDKNPHPQDQLMIDRITTLWANFVKHGNPTNDGDSELLPVSWPQITKHINKMPYLVLNSEISIEDRPFKKRMAFWKMFYEYLKLKKLKEETNNRKQQKEQPTKVTTTKGTTTKVTTKKVSVTTRKQPPTQRTTKKVFVTTRKQQPTQRTTKKVFVTTRKQQPTQRTTKKVAVTNPSCDFPIQWFKNLKYCLG